MRPAAAHHLLRAEVRLGSHSFTGGTARPQSRTVCALAERAGDADRGHAAEPRMIAPPPLRAQRARRQSRYHHHLACPACTSSQMSATCSGRSMAAPPSCAAPRPLRRPCRSAGTTRQSTAPQAGGCRARGSRARGCVGERALRPGASAHAADSGTGRAEWPPLPPAHLVQQQHAAGRGIHLACCTVLQERHHLGRAQGIRTADVTPTCGKLQAGMRRTGSRAAAKARSGDRAPAKGARLQWHLVSPASSSLCSTVRRGP